MEIGISYSNASGSPFENYCFLAQRFDVKYGFRSGESESWVFVADRESDGETKFSTKYTSDSFFSGLWRSLDGNVYVSDADMGEIYSASIPSASAAAPWVRTKLGATMEGVWGINSSCVFAWGLGYKGGYPLFRFDGTQWSSIPDPGFWIFSMHGKSPDLVYAVGEKGRIARFDGQSWQSFPSPTSENLTSVFVESGDEIYAVGRQGSVLEGSSHGWSKIAEGPGLPGPLFAVAKWQGELWLAAGVFGLLRRIGRTERLEVVKPNLPAKAFDTRNDMLVCCENRVAFTKDGKAFKSAGLDALKNIRKDKALKDFT